MSASLDADVVVVGLGPVGAVMALLLARRGLRVIAAERSLGIHRLPRAAHFDHEIMRVFQELGVVDAIADSIRPTTAYEFRSAGGAALLRFDPDARGSLSGWSSGYLIHQPGVEAALGEAMARQPGVEVRRGWTVTDLKQDAWGVRLALSGPDGDAFLSARFVVGCDGASSRVREALGVELEDLGFDEPWLVVDALVAADNALPDISLQICDPRRPTTYVPMPGKRRRWEFMLHPGEDAAQALDEAFLHEQLSSWPLGAGAVIERRAVYRFHALVARHWRQGRVFLAGDAAHQMPPFAGQGMCSGIRDAANLAWKIGAVLADGADPALLDTYETERAPHVRAYIALAIDMGRVVCTLDPAAAAQRDAAMLAAQAAGTSPIPPLVPPCLGPGAIVEALSGAGALFPQPWAPTAEGAARLDDVLGPGAWLIHREPSPPAMDGAGVSAVATSEVRVAPFRGALEAWLSTAGTDAVLVRPDRYVFGTGVARDLLHTYARALRPSLGAAA